MHDTARLSLVTPEPIGASEPIAMPRPVAPPEYSIASPDPTLALRSAVAPPAATVLQYVCAKELVRYARQSIVLRSGETGEFLYYLESGRIKLSVYSRGGREAIVALLGPGQFLGEACLSDQAFNTATAICLTHCRLWRMHRTVVQSTLRSSAAFADAFIREMVTRNRRYEADIVDHLFNRSEQRLARALLLMAHFGEHDRLKFLPHVSHQTLADLVGTTRARITHFMNRFRDFGFINYDRHHIDVHDSLRNVLADE